MERRNRKLVTYSRYATGQQASETPQKRYEVDKSCNSKFYVQRKREERAGQESRPGSGAHDETLADSLPSNTSVYDPISSDDDGQAYTRIQSKRRKRAFEKQGQQTHERRAYAHHDPLVVTRLESRNEGPSHSNRTEVATGRAASQQRGNGKRLERPSTRKIRHESTHPASIAETTSSETHEFRRRLANCIACRQPGDCVSHRDFGNARLSAESVSINASSSQSFLSTSHASSDATPRRKRLVDMLAMSEKSERERLTSAAIQDELTNSSPIHSESTYDDASEDEPMRSGNSEIERDNSENSKEPAAPVKSYLQSSTVTYARQRSFLSDMSIAIELDSQDGRAPSQTVQQTRQPQAVTGPSSFSLTDEDVECNGTRPVRSIHELRQAGENARFKASVDSIFEDIEDSCNSTSGRCNGFIQLCQKLLEPRVARCFVECGFEKRLLEVITDDLDAISATLALCAYELISQCSPLPPTFSIPFWSKVLVFLFKLLEIEDDISELTKQRRHGLPRTVQASIQVISQQLSSALSKDDLPLQVSPQILMLRCIHSTMLCFRGKSDSIHNIPLSLLTHIVEFLPPENHHGDHINLPGHFQVLALAFSILESYTLLSGPLADDYQNVMRPLSHLHHFISPEEHHNDRSHQISVLYMRVILNLTNNNPSFCTEFATLELVDKLVKRVVAEFCKVSEISPVRHADSLEAVVLALGILINLTEESEESRVIILDPEFNSVSSFRMLLDLFVSKIGFTSEVNRHEISLGYVSDDFVQAHSVVEVHHNVAIGYLSIFLAILCLDARARDEVRISLNGKGLAVVLSTVDEFLRYHQRVDQNSHSYEATGSQSTTFASRLRNILCQIQDSEAD